MNSREHAKLPRALFVTGTDTDCGKTFVSSALICALANQGYRVVGMKPVASGSNLIRGALVNSDVESLKYFANVDLPDRTINPYIYAPAISPHFAAEQSENPINLDKIIDAYHQCLNASDIVIVEGAGGWRVPLGKQSDLSTLVKALEIPVMLVGGLKLGSINHTLLSAESIVNDGVDFIGWVANLIDPDYDNVDATVQHIATNIGAPPIAQLGWHPSTGESQEAVHRASRLIDLQKLSARIPSGG